MNIGKGAHKFLSFSDREIEKRCDKKRKQKTNEKALVGEVSRSIVGGEKEACSDSGVHLEVLLTTCPETLETPIPSFGLKLLVQNNSGLVTDLQLLE